MIRNQLTRLLLLLVSIAPILQGQVPGSFVDFEELTVAELAASGRFDGQVYIVTDGNATDDCTVGGGTERVWCEWDGSAWSAFGGGSGAPVDAQYWLGAADATLSAEIVVNDLASLESAVSSYDFSDASNLDTGDLAAARMATHWGTAGTSACATSGGVMFDDGTAVGCDAGFTWSGTQLAADGVTDTSVLITGGSSQTSDLLVINSDGGGGEAALSRFGLWSSDGLRAIGANPSYSIGVGGISLRNSSTMSWSIGANSTGAKDLGLSRAVAGVLKVTDGSTGDGAIFASNLVFQDITASTGDTLLICKGGAGETGNCLEIQNNAGTVNAGITEDGDLSADGSITFSGLVSCDTIDTDANGLLSCGTDDGGSGSGDAIEVEDGDNAGTFSAIDTTAQFEDSADINFALVDGGAGGPDQITGTVRANAVNASKTDVTDAYDWTGAHTFTSINAIRYCDQFASLQACHDDLPAGGGMMIVPAGTYTLTAQLDLNKSNLKVQCAGIGNTIIQRGTFGVDAATVSISGSNSIVRDCTFDGNAISTSFALISLSDNDILFQANEVFEPEHIGVSAAGFSRIKILDNRITGKAATGSVNNFGIWHDNTSNTDLLIQGNTIRGMAANAIFGSGTRITIRDNQILDNHYNTAPGGGQIALDDSSDVLIEGNTIGAGGGTQTSGIELDAGGGPAGQRIVIQGNTIRGQNWQGISANSSGVEDLVIANNVITNSGTAGTNQPAIDIPASMSNFQIIGNRVFDDQGTQTQTYAVEIAAGASNNYIITDNDFHGNKTGEVRDGGTGANKHVEHDYPLFVYNGPRNTAHFYDEFFGGTAATGNIGDQGWNLSGECDAVHTALGGTPGLFQVRTTANADDNCTIYIVARTSGGSSIDAVFEGHLAVVDNDANAQYRIGLSAATPGDPPTDGIYFEKLAADTNWFAVTRGSSTQTRTDTGVAVSTSFASFRIHRKSSGTEACFSIDGSTEVCNSTNYPTAGLVFFVQADTATTAAKSIRADYVEYFEKVSR